MPSEVPVVSVTRLLRARINDRLARATRYPIALVVAPAGFGKSVALRDFIETTRLDAVRYDVRRDDGSLLAFVRGLAAALRPLAPGAETALAAVQARVLGATDPVSELVDWFAEHVRRSVGTVVIDDLHFADVDSVELLTRLMERTEGRLSWIVASRSDAGVPVASWIGYGRMDVPLGEGDLRFTPEEALAAADEAQATVEPHEIEALRDLTGGWPVALAIALRTRTHAADLRTAASGTREMVYRYLAEQVFAALLPAQRDFVLRSAVFHTLDGGIAEALGAHAAFFAEVRRAVTFLTPVSPTTYRYHDLFRDFLENQLRASGERAWRDAHLEAAAILEVRGESAQALALATLAGDGPALLQLIERDGMALFERGAADVLAAALDAIAEPVRRDNPVALGLRAMLEAGRGRFDVAQRGFVAAVLRARDPELRMALVARYAIELVRHDRDSIELLEPHAADDSVPLHLRVPILGTLATAYARVGRHDDARVAITRALDLLETFDDDVRARIYQQAAYVHQFGPSRDRARGYASHAAELALAGGLYDVAARAHSVLYTLITDDTDDPIASLAILDRLGECARKGVSLQARAFGVVAAYGIQVERGDDLAIAALDGEMDAMQLAPATSLTEVLLPAQALRAAWSGDFAAAYDALAGTASQQHSDERRALRAAETALYAIAAGRAEEGDAEIKLALSALEAAGTPATRRTARTLLFLALAELARGRAPAAHRHLTDAERYIGPTMRRMRALAQTVRTLYRIALGQIEAATLAGALERLRAEHFGGVARLLDAIRFATADAPGFSALTPAEREILQLLATGASSKDVAARTGRSPQTVDTHIRSLCRKLNCSGRREAVARATSAGWIRVPEAG